MKDITIIFYIYSMFYWKTFVLQFCLVDYLTDRAKMCASLTYHNFLDLRSARGASLTIAMINLEIILKIAPAINPINACAVSFDSLLQHIPNRPQQALRIRGRTRVRLSQRVYAGNMQSFVCIDIPQSGNKSLVH